MNASLDNGVLNQFDGNSALLFSDLNPGVGHLFDVFVAKHTGLIVPSFYQTFCSDVEHHEWLMQCARDSLRDMHLNGKLTVAGYPDALKEMPKSEPDKCPSMPALNVLVAHPKSSPTAQKMAIPQDVVKAWHDHATFGTRFRSFLEQFYEEFGQNDDDNVDQAKGETP